MIPQSRRLREAIFLVIGVVTPLGILAVNGSAFVMRHLSDFRLILSVSAFVSALFLNGLAAWAIWGRARRHVPDLLTEYRVWALILVALVVLASAASGAYFTWIGLSTASRLPDPISTITAAAFLIVPFGVTYLVRRLDERRRSGRARAAQAPGAQPARHQPPPAAPRQSRRAP